MSKLDDIFQTEDTNSYKKYGLSGQSKYSFDSSVFPENLGQTSGTNGIHYMMININVQDRSTWGKDTNGRSYFTRLPGETATSDRIRHGASSFGPAGTSTSYLSQDAIVNGLRSAVSLFGGGADNSGTQQQNYENGGAAGVMRGPGGNNIAGDITRNGFDFINELTGGGHGVNLGRGTSRSVESIALMMPDNLEYRSSNDYTPLKLTGMIADGITAATRGIPFVGAAASAAKTAVGNAAQLMGAPINPKIEVLFRETAQRVFTFNLLFAPETQTETEAMENIIEKLRFHSAPEFDKGIGGFTMTPPSEFDISFYHDNKENTSLPKLTTCVLERMDVNYAPFNQFQTFSNGSPVACRVILTFQETEVITKRHVALGF